MPRTIVPVFVWTFFALAFAIVCPRARATVLTGKVVEITSGETLVITDDKGKSHQVHLHAIASPVAEQPYFDASRQILERVALNKRAWVDWFEKHGKVVTGKVFVNTEDLAIKLLKRGAVWYDRRQACDQSVSDRGIYADAEAEATRLKAGLWHDAHAVEPWLWEKSAGRTERSLATKPTKKNKQKQKPCKH